MIDSTGNRAMASWYFSIISLVWIVAAGCSGDNGTLGKDQTGSGDLQVRMVWQTQSDGMTMLQSPPSGDVCVDFLITGIQIRVKTASGDISAESEILPCSDHMARLESIAAQSGYTVEVDGLINDKVQWFGEKGDIAVIADQDTDPIVVEMNFIGEVLAPPLATILPANSATNVPTDTVVTVRFDKAVVENTVNANSILITNGDEPIPGSVAYNPATLEAVFLPDQELSVSTSYTVTVTTDVMDLSGQNMAQEINSQFFTTTIWYVDESLAASGSGKIWSEAFRTIAEAMEAAGGGDQIWVKKGIYRPVGQIAVTKPVELLGGFAGTETQHHQRDWLVHETVIDGNDEYRCLFISADASIDGFTVKNGYQHNSSIAQGGAMYIDAASPKIANSLFVANKVQSGSSYGHGGAIYIAAGDPAFKGCTFRGNKAGGDGFGGAIYNAKGDLSISGCIFKDNTTNYGNEGSGGAISNFEAKANVTDCLFDANSASSEGPFGGAIYNQSSDIKISGCRFMNNTCFGRVGRGGVIANSSSNVDIQNSIFDTNRVTAAGISSYGGAIYNTDSSLSITNSAFSFNESLEEYESIQLNTFGGAVASVNSSNTTIINSIIWGNQAKTGVQIHDDETSTTSISYSNVDQWFPGNQNIQRNPRFGADLHLRSDSLSIGKADNNTTPALDMDGESRPQGPVADMGADEFVDNDNNKLPDYWESLHSVSIADNDEDGDNIPNLSEYNLGTDPKKAEAVIGTTLRGTIRNDGLRQPLDSNTLTGTLNDQRYRSFFVFNVSGDTTVKRAAIRLELVSYGDSNAVPETFQIWDVSSTAAVLAAGTSGTTGIEIFNDLGRGILYGEFETVPSDKGTVLDVWLNPQAVKAINASAAGSGEFIIGLDLEGFDSGHLSFSTTDEIRIHQLVLAE